MGWAKYTEDNAEVIAERQQGDSFDAINLNYTGYLSVIDAAYSIPLTSFEDKYIDKHIHCYDCGKSILFTSESQKQYKVHGWKQPKRCRKCRDRHNIRFAMQPSY